MDNDNDGLHTELLQSVTTQRGAVSRTKYDLVKVGREDEMDCVIHRIPVGVSRV